MSRPSPIRTAEHPITDDLIDEDAAKVLRRLNQFGHEAYLVGGGVRDLLLGRQPKDFDIVTSARPNEVRRLFRNCRLIGRRFRLAHILFSQGKIIECATFRAKPPEPDSGDLIVDDNEFGTPATDARRRDFTVNGLFYDQKHNEVIDFVGGLGDLNRRSLRTIGEPGLRFREDPVRMLRAVKFMARLGLELDETNRRAIVAERAELSKAAIPRLYEELVRMLREGASARSYQLLQDLGLLEMMLPEISAWARRPDVVDGWVPMARTLTALDDYCKADGPISNGLLLAALYWPVYQTLVDPYADQCKPRDLARMAQALVSPAAARMRMPRRDMFCVITALECQYRQKHAMTRKARKISFVREMGFPETLGLMKIRAASEGLPSEPIQMWADLASEHRVASKGRSGGRRRRRRR